MPPGLIMLMRMRHITLFLLALLLGGCVLGRSDHSSDLQALLTRYESAMRWGYWDAVLSCRHAESPPLPSLDLDNIQITAYEVRKPTLLVDPETATQTVEISYVRKNEQTLRKTRDEQLWRYDAEHEQWWLHSPFPELR